MPLVVQAPRHFSPGSAYVPEQGKLYLFDPSGVLVVRAWPDPRAWRLGRVGPWKGARPIGLDLAAPDRKARPSSERCRRKLACQAQAFAAIPVEQRRLAARFGTRAWPLHCLFSRVPGSMQLAQLCPALAAGLAFHSKLRPAVTRPYRSTRALLAKPPAFIARSVAAWLGFPPGRATVRVLRRLPPSLCGPADLRLLQQALAHPSLRRSLCHLPRINGAVLTLLHHQLAPSSPIRSAGPLLQHLARLPAVQAGAARGRLAGLIPAWKEAWPDRPLPPLISPSQLDKLRAHAHAELASPERLRLWAHALGPFATAPVPPDNGLGLELRPLACVDHLIAEAEFMCHCIASREYVRDSVQGTGLGYAVRGSPTGLHGLRERATVWVVRADHGHARLAQLHGPGNEPPTESLVAAVQAWIHQHNYPDIAPRVRGDAFDRQRHLGHTLRVMRVRRHGPRPPTVPVPHTRLAPPPPGQQQLLPFIAPF